MSLWNPIDTISAGSNMFDSFLHPEKGYEKAEKASRQGYEESKQYQLPYQQWGMQVHPNLAKAFLNLEDPAKLQGEWANSYETSPQAQRAMEMSKGQGMDAASSMGLMGSSAAMGNIQQGAGDIMLKDRQNFLNDLMQKYMSAIGLGTNLYNTGAQVGQNMGNNAVRQSENMAQLAYNKQNAPGQMFGGMLSGAAQMLPMM